MTLTHPQCLTLKEKGFPQGKGPYYVDPNDEPWDTTMQSDYETPGTPVRSTWVYCPTLESLIEACGEEFYDLQSKGNGFWYASGNKDGDWLDGSGSSPSEALFNLWVSLH